MRTSSNVKPVEISLSGRFSLMLYSARRYSGSSRSGSEVGYWFDSLFLHGRFARHSDFCECKMRLAFGLRDVAISPRSKGSHLAERNGVILHRARHSSDCNCRGIAVPQRSKWREFAFIVARRRMVARRYSVPLVWLRRSWNSV